MYYDVNCKSNRKKIAALQKLSGYTSILMATLFRITCNEICLYIDLYV